MLGLGPLGPAHPAENLVKRADLVKLAAFTAHGLRKGEHYAARQVPNVQAQ